MATTKAVFDLFTAIFDDLSVDELKQLTRPLRAAGLWPSGKGGRAGAGAAQVNTEHLAALTLAVFTRMPPPKVLGAVTLYGNFRPLQAWIFERHGDEITPAKWNGKFSTLKGPIRKFMNERAGRALFKTEPKFKFQFMPGVTILGVFAELLEAGRNPALDLSRLHFVIDHSINSIIFSILENHVNWQEARWIWRQLYIPLPPNKGLIEMKEHIEEDGGGPIANTIFDYPGREFDVERGLGLKKLPIIRTSKIGGEIFRMIGAIND